ncbi:hypothetical protein PJL15_04341 [Paenarthrobacter nitroguajacolicus]|nr:hypothetical protein [Paenarthrobacter nitroguajacolicus]
MPGFVQGVIDWRIDSGIEGVVKVNAVRKVDNDHASNIGT